MCDCYFIASRVSSKFAGIIEYPVIGETLSQAKYIPVPHISSLRYVIVPLNYLLSIEKKSGRCKQVSREVSNELDFSFSVNSVWNPERTSSKRFKLAQTNLDQLKEFSSIG